MKKNLNLLLSFAFLSILFASCSSSSMISNGAYSDVSLNQNSDQFKIKRLSEVRAEAKAIFGIPLDDDLGNKSGLIVRFNGINLSGSTNRILPIATLIGLSIFSGSYISEWFGYKKDVNGFDVNKKFPTGAAAFLALPVTGAINNAIWSGTSAGRASQKLNIQLLENNPDIDVFMNPKHNITTTGSLWTQKTSITSRVMGATLKTA